VIDKLGEEVSAVRSKVGLAYIYCDYRDQKGQTIENILGSVLKQLLNLLPEIPEPVVERYEQEGAREKPLRSTDAIELIRIACTQFGEVYICLDALDEVANLRELLERLCEIPSSVKLFITERHHVQVTIQEYLKEDNVISITAQKKDIRLFIEHEIGGPNDLEPGAMDEKLRQDIFEKVLDSAEGL
jgi:hypothetical protein